MWLKNVPIAHRGFHDKKSPENSLSAFQNAIDRGFGIETDIQLLSDGEVVVFHDKTLERMCGVHGDLYKMKKEQLEGLTLLDSGEKIPFLQDLLALTSGKVPLLIELKLHGDTKIEALCLAVAKILDSYQGDFALQAFHPYIVKWFYLNRPHFLRGQLSCFFEEEKMPLHQKILLKHMFFNRKTKPHFVAYDVKHIKSRIVRRARKKYPVLAWTVTASHNLSVLDDFCDNIIFEGFTP